jgi:hypothetical protein
MKHDQSAPTRAPKRYLDNRGVRARYGWRSSLSVARAWKVYGTLRPPSLYRGRHPLWDEQVLDEDDAAQGAKVAQTAAAASAKAAQRYAERGEL